MQDTETNKQNILLAKNYPSLIDEWQVIPFIWDQIRFEVDHRQERGQFILTGSATPIDDDSYVHSGIGRIVPMVMRPMSLYESQDGNGSVSLRMLFDNPNLFKPAICDLKLRDYAFLLCRGDWPASIGLEREGALEQAYNFYNGLVEDDINKVFRKTKNPERIKRFMRSYSRAIASDMSNSSLKKELIVNDGETFDEDTIASYVNALSRLFVIEELTAWNPTLRSKTAIRSSNTRHFVDPSIACAALGFGPDDLINDLETFGLWFEYMCVRDLRVYAEKLKGQIFCYRDKRGLKSDAIIHLRDGRWATVEVKLYSGDSIEEGALHLLKLASDIDTSREKAPSFLMVLTATGYAYRRKDGVYVIPIGCLKD